MPSTQEDGPSDPLHTTLLFHPSILQINILSLDPEVRDREYVVQNLRPAWGVMDLPFVLLGVWLIRRMVRHYLIDEEGDGGSNIWVVMIGLILGTWFYGKLFRVQKGEPSFLIRQTAVCNETED